MGGQGGSENGEKLDEDKNRRWEMERNKTREKETESERERRGRGKSKWNKGRYKIEKTLPRFSVERAL